MDYKNVNDYELLYLISENMDVSYDILYQKYLPIIKSIASKYFNFASRCGAEYQDLIQEGYIGLNSAIVNYRNDNNTIFYTFATVCIERTIRTYCRSLSALKHQNLNFSISDSDYSLNIIPDHTFFGEFCNSTSKELIECIFLSSYMLDLETRCVFEMRYNGFSNKEIAELLDLNLSSVESKICKARKFLKKVIENYNLY